MCASKQHQPVKQTLRPANLPENVELETRTALCALDVIDEIYPDARALTDFIRRWSNTLFDCWQRDRTPRLAPQVPDPVNQDELWQRYGICKALAFALWQTRQARSASPRGTRRSQGHWLGCGPECLLEVRLVVAASRCPSRTRTCTRSSSPKRGLARDIPRPAISRPHDRGADLLAPRLCRNDLRIGRVCRGLHGRPWRHRAFRLPNLRRRFGRRVLRLPGQCPDQRRNRTPRRDVRDGLVVRGNVCRRLSGTQSVDHRRLLRAQSDRRLIMAVQPL